MLTFQAIAFHEVTRSKTCITLIVNVLTELLALNVTAMLCPGGLSCQTAKTANGVGLFGMITSRCQTNIETFNIEVQKLTRLCITQDRGRFLAIDVIG